MRRVHRKSAPKVRDGIVRHKNRWELSPHYTLVEPGKPIIERQRPGRGYRHLILKRDVELFISLLPNWAELSQGLRAILLAPHRTNTMGWHRPGVVALCPWEREIAGPWSSWFVEEHRHVLDRLGVETEPADEEDTEYVHWTERSAKGFQLMHVLWFCLCERLCSSSLVQVAAREL